MTTDGRVITAGVSSPASHYTYTAQDPARGHYVRKECTLGQDEFTRGTYVMVRDRKARTAIRYEMTKADVPFDLFTLDVDATSDDYRAANAFLAYLEGVGAP